MTNEPEDPREKNMLDIKNNFKFEKHLCNLQIQSWLMDEYVKIIYTRITFMNTLPQASDTDISYNGENKNKLYTH